MAKGLTGGSKHAGSAFHNFIDSVLPLRARLCPRLREFAMRTRDMSLETIVSLAVAGLLLCYLTYALLRPEKF